MIFICKKGIQQQPSTAEEEVEQEVKEEETEPAVHIAHEGAAEGEAGLSKVKRGNIDKLEEEFVQFRAKTKSNFADVRQQLQDQQTETLQTLKLSLSCWRA